MLIEDTKRSPIKIRLIQKVLEESKSFTFLKIFRKETCEKELAQIEKDLEKLNKIHCFIDYTN